MNAPLVLIVEDERDIADLLADYFEMEGYRTVTASNAADAVESCRRGPDVILLDVNLPDGDGFEVCRKVRESVACPIVFLTARVEDADAIAGFAAGGDDYVTKPFSLEVLGARVRAHLARSERSSERAVVGFSCGISIDFGAREARVNGRPVELARKDSTTPAPIAAAPAIAPRPRAFAASSKRAPEGQALSLPELLALSVEETLPHVADVRKAHENRKPCMTWDWGTLRSARPRRRYRAIWLTLRCLRLPGR